MSELDGGVGRALGLLFLALAVAFAAGFLVATVIFA